ncbi:choice-of-anchor I family protein [Actinoalloteichus hymeniacidonis]|uniref:Choice-of-anchor I domain-containing protein n=1 Tax=Actinoalloteichus hymeniacidonis TaxID=340345 RepID=A0AAC9HMF3_9PSEU|nr:choice-of-anchor I family protein [Actinoalloteichus hymeniacidonis]AOS61856.1 hypothetical protein TL08_05140 [Actinoalloteichus hymeniacidonis]MBB5910124.1 LPXTG-motif cell wall-anchored protein [Actinoalloteichus hymeniacidonis]
MRRHAVAALAVTTIAALAAPPVFAQSAEPGAIGPGPLELSVLGTHETGVFDASAAEIVAHDPQTQHLFVVNAAAAQIDVLDIADPTRPSLVESLDTVGIPAADGSQVGAGAVVNSVAVRADGVVAVAVEADPKTDPGWVVFYDTDGARLSALRVGSLPDMLTFTEDGGTLLIANEGEPAEDYSVDPEGSIAVVDVSGDIESIGQESVRTADFHAWDAGGDRELPADVRVFGPNTDPAARVSENLEPEYIAVDADGTRAYAALQEANAIAVVDIAAAEVLDILPLGQKDHLLPGNELDVSNKDDEIALKSWPIKGMYQPDGMAAFQAAGSTYLVTANEGDSRDWEAYGEEYRVADLVTEVAPLCQDAFADFPGGTDALIAEENLGRLNVTAANGLRDGDEPCYEELHSFGARSFSVWTTDGEQVFDSGSDFERITAELYPEMFNSNHTENTFDNRSDDKGPEPEGITLGEVDGRTYAFIGLERIGGVMIYDVSDPTAPEFVQYVNNRNFDGDPESDQWQQAGDLGAEGLTFIAEANSPVPGTPVLVVANEVSGTTTLFEIGSSDSDGPGEPGDPDPSTPPETTDPTDPPQPTESETTTPSVPGADGGDDDSAAPTPDDLADTGADVGLAVLAGLLLLGGGAALWLFGRRRRSA